MTKQLLHLVIGDLGKRTTDKAVDLTRETVDKAEDMTRGGFRAVERTVGAAREVERAVTRRSAEGTAEFGQAFTGLFKEQAQHNVDTMSALTGAVDWKQVARRSTGSRSLRSRPATCA